MALCYTAPRRPAMDPKKLEKRKELAWEFARFVANAGVVLAVKLAGVALLTPYMHAAVAYALIHVVTVLLSYVLHAFISFKGTASFRDFWQFLKAVLAVKIADYVVFNVLFTYFEIRALSSVVLATAVIFVVRFITIRRALGGGRAAKEEPK